MVAKYSRALNPPVKQAATPSLHILVCHGKRSYPPRYLCDTLRSHVLHTEEECRVEHSFGSDSYRGMTGVANEFV